MTAINASQSYTLPGALPLDSGETLDDVQIAYETYGELNADKSNAILICHALTGDQYVASDHPLTGKPGWWERMVGPGKPVDTDRFHVICANVIGSITIRDMVRGLVALLDGLGIAQLHTVIGGSMGGMQALSLAANFPTRAQRVLVLAIPIGARGIIARRMMRKRPTLASLWRAWPRISLTFPKKG